MAWARPPYLPSAASSRCRCPAALSRCGAALAKQFSDTKQRVHPQHRPGRSAPAPAPAGLRGRAPCPAGQRTGTAAPPAPPPRRAPPYLPAVATRPGPSGRTRQHSRSLPVPLPAGPGLKEAARRRDPPPPRLPATGAPEPQPSRGAPAPSEEEPGQENRKGRASGGDRNTARTGGAAARSAAGRRVCPGHPGNQKVPWAPFSFARSHWPRQRKRLCGEQGTAAGAGHSPALTAFSAKARKCSAAP